MTRKAPRLLGRDSFGLLSTAALIFLVGETCAVAQATPTTTFTNEQYHYTVALPEGCRHEEGPGTLDAICSSDFDAERSARANSASALAMQVTAEFDEAAPGGSTPAAAYDEKAFREELPQSVCGESDVSRARIENLKQATEDNRAIYTADVMCAGVSFLQIPERRASVRYVFGSDRRYRLLARAPIEVFEKNKEAIAAFFGSFRVLQAKDKGQ